MKKRILSVILVMLMIAGMVACSNDRAEVDTPAPAGEQTLRLGTLQSGANDKIETPWQNLSLPTMLMFRSLFFAEPDLTTLNSDLADVNYTVSDDGLVYTITMLDGNKWSDGNDITAADVAFSIKTNLRAAVSNGIYTSAFSKIVGADAWKDGSADDLEGLVVDGNTITISLAAPYKAMPAVLAQFAILPEHILNGADPLELHNNEFWSHPVTSNMFTITEFNAGNYYVMEPNPYYTGVAPKINKVIVSVIADWITGVKTGQVDYFNTNNLDIISEVNKVDGMSMHNVDILFFRYFICNMMGADGNQNPAMQDIRVRQAILHAIDRETLVSSLFPGLGTVCNAGVVNDSSAFNGTVFEYNPEKAKALLEEAQYDFSRPIRILYYYSDQASIDFMEAIAYYLGEIGLTVELTQTTQSTQDLFQTRNYDIGYKGLSAFDISEWYGEYSSANANFRNIFGGDTSFDDLITQLAASTSEDAAQKILTELNTLENDTLYKLPLFTLGNNVFTNSNHLKLPADLVFGNPWYRTNIHFTDWEIVGE